MRTVGYVVVGYFLLSFAATGLVYSSMSPVGLLVLAAAVGAFVWMIRSYRRGKEDETVRRDDVARVETLHRRLASRAASVLDALPADPLALPALVDLAYASRAEPGEQERLEREYEDARRSAADVGDQLERLRAERRAGVTHASLLLGEYERLERELAAAEEYVDSIEMRADEAKALADIAPARIAEAEAALGEARSARERLGAAAPADAAPAIREAEQALVQARTSGEERALAAARLAERAAESARTLRDRLDALAELPARVATKVAELEATGARLDEELARRADELKAASGKYPASALAEILAGHAAAEAARAEGEALLVNARAKAASADLGELAGVERALVDSSETLARATALAAGVGAELERLASAALEARGKVEAAEAAVDEAWAAYRTSCRPAEDGREAVLDRARELAGHARQELEAETPDWRHAVTLAARALELAAGVDASPALLDPTGADRVEAAEARAKAARDGAWAWALSAQAGSTVNALAQQVEDAYRAAIAAREALPTAGSPGHDVAAARVLAAFANVEEVAAIAEKAAIDARSRTGSAAASQAGSSTHMIAGLALGVVLDDLLDG